MASRDPLTISRAGHRYYRKVIEGPRPRTRCSVEGKMAWVVGDSGIDGESSMTIFEQLPAAVAESRPNGKFGAAFAGQLQILKRANHSLRFLAYNAELRCRGC